MAPVTMPPVEEAKSIFRRLGYTVSGDGTELRAERKWRTVQVTAMATDEADTSLAIADGGHDDRPELRCFVTWNEYTGDLVNRLESLDPPFEWAIIGVDDATSYEVVTAT